MNRLFLTLLALLTGLAAQVSPAQAAARRAGETEIGVLAGAHQEQRLAPSAIAARHHVPPSGLAGGDYRAAPQLPAQRHPTVLIGIDRARE